MREAMRVCWIITLIFLAGTSSSAQDQPLGDVARAARAQKAASPHAAKVLTDDDFHPKTEPVAATETPLDVVNKSRVALLRDVSPSCRRETSGNSGPGWAEVRVMEAAGPDRAHILIDQSRPNPLRTEFIIIEKDVCHRSGNAPWEKMWADQAKASVSTLGDAQVPDVLKFGYHGADLKLVGPQTVDGSPAFLYEYDVRAGDMDRKIEMWIGANDHMPLRTHMLTVTKSWGIGPVTWQQTTTCRYGVALNIERPM
jgi:hypothetical protein